MLLRTLPWGWGGTGPAGSSWRAGCSSRRGTARPWTPQECPEQQWNSCFNPILHQLYKSNSKFFFFSNKRFQIKQSPSLFPQELWLQNLWFQNSRGTVYEFRDPLHATVFLRCTMYIRWLINFSYRFIANFPGTTKRKIDRFYIFLEYCNS